MGLTGGFSRTPLQVFDGGGVGFVGLLGVGGGPVSSFSSLFLGGWMGGLI